MSNNKACNESAADDKGLKPIWLLLDDNNKKLKSADALNVCIDKLSKNYHLNMIMTNYE